MIKCYNCYELLSRDTTALNKKLLGRQTKQFLCLKCLSDFLETEIDELKEKIQFFKDTGCTLFL